MFKVESIPLPIDNLGVPLFLGFFWFSIPDFQLNTQI